MEIYERDRLPLLESGEVFDLTFSHIHSLEGSVSEGSFADLMHSLFHDMYEASGDPVVFDTADLLNWIHVFVRRTDPMLERDPDLREHTLSVKDFNPGRFIRTDIPDVLQLAEMKLGINWGGMGIRDGSTDTPIPEIRAYYGIDPTVPKISSQAHLSPSFLPAETIQKPHHHAFNQELILATRGVTTAAVMDANNSIIAEHDLHPGDYFLVNPNTQHTLINRTPFTTEHVGAKLPLKAFGDRIDASPENPTYEYSIGSLTEGPVRLTHLGRNYAVGLATNTEQMVLHSSRPAAALVLGSCAQVTRADGEPPLEAYRHEGLLSLQDGRFVESDQHMLYLAEIS